MAVMLMVKQNIDFILWTSVDYAVSRVGGPVVYYDDNPNLSGVTELCIVGHGSPGQIEYKPAETMAKRLTEGRKALPDGFKKLIVTSCYAGCLVGNKDGTAVIDIIAAAFTKRGMTGISITGALGPSIKANVLGALFKVVNSGTATESPGNIQDELILKHGVGVGKPGEVTRYTGNVGDSKVAAEAAAIMAKISGEFYKEFVDKLEDVRALYDPDGSTRTVVS